MNRPDTQTPRPRSRRREEAVPAPAAGNGWPRVRLGEVCVSKTGTRNPVDAPDSSFRYVDITSVDNVSKRIVAPKELFGRDAPSRARQVIRTGDVLVSTTRPNLNAVALVPPELDGEIASTGFCVLRGSEEMDSEFLFSFVRTPEFVSRLTELTKGALYPAVNDKQVFAQFISLPPLAEQRRIAGRLREQMAEVARARAAVQAQLATAQALPAAVLRAHFTTPAALRWPRRKVGELVVSPLRTGLSKSAKADSPWRCLGLSSVRDGNLIMDAAKPVDVTAHEAEANRIRAGAFYVVRGNGNLRLVARGALAPQTVTEPILFPDLLIEMNPDTERILPLYLRWVWDSAEVRTALEDRARTSAGIHKINLRNLAGVEIPLPPLAEQRALAARLTAELSAATALRESLTARLAAIERLPAALLSTAFTPGQSA